jgi:hypothetical protein
MALKADRYEKATDISHFYSAGAVTRGGVVVLDNVNASGAAMDQAANKVKYKAATTTDIVRGILLNDVVSKDQTQTHLDIYKNEVPLNGKVTIMTEGYVVTNKITGTPAPGDPAYADGTTAGNLINTADDAVASGNLRVGRFDTNKDADGYAKVSVNLPN